MDVKASHDAGRVGVLLAAGRGGRMGQTKQLLFWPSDGGSKPLVTAAFDSISAVCQEMIVVLGHDADHVSQALDQREFHAVMSDPDAEMFASVRASLSAAKQIDARADILLHPADHPDVLRKTLDSLIRVAGDHRDCAVMPVYRGKGGHPVLIPARLVDAILGYDGHGGLRQYWIDHPESCLRLVVSDASVVQDLDTQADYWSVAQPEAGGQAAE